VAVPLLTWARPAGGAGLVVGSRGTRGGDRPAVLALDVQVRHQPARLRRVARQHAVPRPAGTPGRRRARGARARRSRGPHLRPEDCRDVHPRLLARQDLRRRRRPAPVSPRAARTERAPSPGRPLTWLVWLGVGRRVACWAICAAARRWQARAQASSTLASGLSDATMAARLSSWRSASMSVLFSSTKSAHLPPEHGGAKLSFEAKQAGTVMRVLQTLSSCTHGGSDVLHTKVQGAVGAHSICSTSRSTTGRRLPPSPRSGRAASATREA